VPVISATRRQLKPVAAGASPGAHDAVAEPATAWAARSSLTGDGVALALRVGLGARREAAPVSPRLDGPGATGEQRFTAAVLHELVVDARERILLVSFAAYTLTELAADLEAAVGRGCQVDIVSRPRRTAPALIPVPIPTRSAM
jgi:hypothetical protein